MKHELKRKREGSGITEMLTPTCSCGWVGRGYEAYNDWQHTMVKDQEDKHLADVRKAATAHLRKPSR